MDDGVVVTPLRAYRRRVEQCWDQFERAIFADCMLGGLRADMFRREVPSRSASAQVAYRTYPLAETRQAIMARMDPSSREAVVDFCDRFRSWMSVDLPPNDLFQDTLWMWAPPAALQKVTSAGIVLVSDRALQLFQGHEWMSFTVQMEDEIRELPPDIRPAILYRLLEQAGRTAMVELYYKERGAVPPAPGSGDLPPAP